MTASQFANLLHARRIGKGKYVAKCPSHPDKKPSLSIAEGKRGVLVRCMSAGCDTKDILEALGLSYSDLFYDKATPAIRARLSLQDHWEGLERQLGLAMWLEVMERPAYWRAAQRRIGDELRRLRCRTEPLRVIREQRGEQWQGMNQRQKDAVLEGIWHDLQNMNGQTQRLKP